MKKICFFAAVVALLAACASPNAYNISGEVVGEKNEGKDIYLFSMGTNLPLDTAVVTNGAFVFEGELEYPDVAIVMIAKSRNYATFILEPGNININLAENGVGSISGTVLNDAMQSVKDEEAKISKEYAEISEKVKAKYEKDSEALKTELEKVYENDIKPKLTALHKSVFEANKSNILGVDIYTNKILNDDTIENIKIFIAQNPFAAKHDPLNRVAEAKVNAAKTAIGQKFTEINGRNMEDTKAVKLSDFVGKGKYVLADFWASWCSPCRAEMPHLAKLHKKYAKDGLVILGVNVSDKLPAAQKSIKDMNMVWSQMYVPEQGYATGLYGIEGIPTIIIFAPDGTIVHRSHGGEEVAKFIKNAFEGK